MSGDLAGWLLTQISEDEARARRAIARSKINEYGEVMNFDLWAEQDWIEIGTAQLQHVEAWHPIRVLAECAAKRAIIDMAQRYDEFDSGEWAFDQVLRQLAQPYSDRPGFRPEWQVTP